MGRCSKFWRKRLCCGGLRFRTFLTPRESQESISCTTRLTGGKGRRVTDAKRRSGELWWQVGAVFSARIARRSLGGRKVAGGQNRFHGAARPREQRRLP